MNKNINLIIIVVVVLVVASGIWYVASNKGAVEPGKYDTFAVCLKDKGAVFYGAFWCPHCQNQKKLFGSSQSLLPYVECSTPDGKAMLQACKDKKVESYPTWEFADASRLTGEIPLSTLAEKTGCSLPQ